MLLPGCISNKPSAEEKGFSAMEKYPQFINISKEWRNDSVLSYLLGSSLSKIMHVSLWEYYFISPSSAQRINNGTAYDTMQIVLYANGSYKCLNWTQGYNYTIVDWYIDSNIALQIMTSIPEVKNYTKEDGVYLSELNLVAASSDNIINIVSGLDGNEPIWYGEWDSSHIPFSDKGGMAVWISAKDGRILFH